jgi:2-polyprenyl-3-methyl-5-hydroxy-6-metoxy-1,4-benzoquinol methylase
LTARLENLEQADDAGSSRGVECGCCGRTAELVCASHPGYRVPGAYDLYHCPACDTTQAFPLAVDVDVYDAIYSQIDRVPGYERYERYARTVSAHAAPLDHLAAREDVYWAIREQLLFRPEPAGNLRVLDAGSGLGHLTYALSRAGYDVRGVDVSEVAVARAKARFGPLFEQADVREFVKTHRAAFDVVTMTEVIEHVPDVGGIVAALLELLRPGGELLVTTPNKSSFAPNALWVTENPPVHLWWFSERSMTALGLRLASDVRFVDFGAFNRAQGAPDRFIEGLPQRRVPFYPPSLDASGRVIETRYHVTSMRGAARTVLDRLRLTDPLLDVRYRFAVRRHGISARRPNMCAVFSQAR